jgi:hypothetical protein
MFATRSDLLAKNKIRNSSEPPFGGANWAYGRGRAEIQLIR